MAKKKKKPEVCCVVFGQDCASGIDDEVTAEDCDAVARVFALAAKAIREGKHGQVLCKYNGELLAEVGIDFGGPFDMEGTGLPVIERVEREEV